MNIWRLLEHHAHGKISKTEKLANIISTPNHPQSPTAGEDILLLSHLTDGNWGRGKWTKQTAKAHPEVSTSSIHKATPSHTTKFFSSPGGSLLVEYNYKYYLLPTFPHFVIRIHQSLLSVKCSEHLADKCSINSKCHFNVLIIIIKMGKVERIWFQHCKF